MGVGKRSPKVENLARYHGAAAVFCVAGSTVYNNQGKIWREQYTMVTLLHAKFGPDQQRGWYRIPLNFKIWSKPILFLAVFRPIGATVYTDQDEFC